MDNASTYKWVVILFFGVVGIIFTVSVFYLAAGNVAPDTYWGRRMTLPASNDHPPLRATDKVVLELDQGRRIGDRIFYYRGRRNGQLVLDVLIPDIDREYLYPFRLDLKDAKNGFDMAGKRFRLVTVRRRFICFQAVP